jgi:hypothetical protein
VRRYGGAVQDATAPVAPREMPCGVGRRANAFTDDDKCLAAAFEGARRVFVTGDSDLLTVPDHAGVRIGNRRAFLEALRESRRSRALL